MQVKLLALSEKQIEEIPKNTGDQPVRKLKRGSRRSFTSSASMLSNIREEDEKEPFRVSVDQTISCSKIIAIVSVCFILGFALTGLTISTIAHNTSFLGANLSFFGTYDSISSFGFKASKIFVDNNRPKDRRLLEPVFYEVSDSNTALITNTFSNCFRFMETTEVSFM